MVEHQNVRDSVASELKRISDAAQKICDIFEEFPELESRFAAAFQKQSNGMQTNGATAIRTRRQSPPSVTATNTFAAIQAITEKYSPGTQRIIDMFCENGNESVPTPKIAGLAGVKDGDVNNAIYNPRSRELFVKHNHPENNKVKLWNLKESEYLARKSNGEVK